MNRRSFYDPKRNFWRRHWLATGILLVSLIAIWIAAYLVIATGETVLRALGGFGEDQAGHLVAVFLGRCLVIGVLSMALIQTLRGLVPLRGRFHETEIRRWLARGWSAEGRLVAPAPPGDSSPRGLSDGREAREKRRPPVDGMISHLVELAVMLRREELFDLRIEKLCGQIGAAVELVVDRPVSDIDQDLLRSLAGRKHADEYLSALSGESMQDNASGNKAGGSAPPRKDHPLETDADRVMLRHQVEQRIRRNIDGLQISVGVRWRRQLRGLAIVVSSVLALGLLGPPQLEVAWFLSIAMTSLIAGYIASVARDLTAVIERWRG